MKTHIHATPDTNLGDWVFGHADKNDLEPPPLREDFFIQNDFASLAHICPQENIFLHATIVEEDGSDVCTAT